MLSLLPCTSSGGYGEEDPKGKEAQALSEAMSLPPCPRPRVGCESHNKEEKLHSSFLVIPAQGTYGHFKLWIALTCTNVNVFNVTMSHVTIS